MTTCSKCGAENKLSADICRMCGTPLSASNAASATPQESAQSSATKAEIACSNCQTMNEADWAFCQQCGKKLQQAPLTPPVVATEQATVVTPSPVSPPGLDRGLKTVPSQTPEVQASPPSPEPPQAAQPPASLETVVDRTPVSPLPAHAGATEVVRSEPLPPRVEGGIACPQCGRLSSADSAFCAHCGASVQVARTIVMASVPAPSKGRLHLIMEGGQTGEVYDLKDETIIGRTTGDITFPHDGFMSGRHASIIRRAGSFVLVDQESRNGTFIKIKGEVELKPGDMVLIGRQLFRFEA